MQTFDRRKYNKEYGALLRQNEAVYQHYLQEERDRKKRRTLRKQQARIEEAAKRIVAVSFDSRVWELYSDHTKAYFIKLATAVLYPEKLDEFNS